MKKLKFILLISLFLFAIYGCGQTNFLEWAKSKESNPSNLEKARTYLDEGEYAKAKNLVQDDNSKEARIIYAECLMGLADVDLAAIVSTLTDETITNNPIIRLEPLINNVDNRDKLLEAADIFISNYPNKTSDKIIGALCCMTAHAANLKNAFDPTNTIGFVNLNTSYSADPLYPLVNVSPNYSALGANPIRYITGASGLILSISHEPTVTDAIASMNEVIVSINNYIGTSPNIQVWYFVRPIFGF